MKSKLPTLVTKEDKKKLPCREMLVLTAQRPNHAFLVAKDEERKSGVNYFSYAYMQYVNDGGEMQYFSDGDDDADCC